MTALLDESPMATKKAPKGIPVKIDRDTYDNLKLVARVQERDIAEVARDLLRAPLTLQLSKLGAEIAQLRKMDETRAALAEKARKKIAD